MTGHIKPLGRALPLTRPAPGRGRGAIGSAVGFLALLAAAGGGYWAIHGRSTAPTVAAAPPPPPAVTVSPPLQRSLAQSTEFTGQFSAVDQVDLRAQVSGYLTEIHVADGQLVHKGDLLFVVDPRPYAIQLQQAVAQYQTAVASLDLANKQVARSTALKRNDFASGETVDQRTQVQQGAVAAVDQAKAAIQAAQLNLDFTRIAAPFNGRVGARQVSVGSLISGGVGAGSGTKLTSLVSLDPIHVDFDMSEADALVYQRYLAASKSGTAGKSGADRSIKLSLSDETGWPRQGELDFIDNQVDRGSGTMHARATVANPDLLIAPGQFARLQVPMSAPRPVLLVPDAALVTDQSRKMVMTVAADGTVTPKPVEIGPLEGDRLRVVASGLAPDDQVVVNGLMRIRPGAKVTPHPGPIDTAAQ
jgi:multidrug efflux system membrane fusion protein